MAEAVQKRRKKKVSCIFKRVEKVESEVYSQVEY